MDEGERVRPQRSAGREVVWVRSTSYPPTPALFWEEPEALYVLLSGPSTRWATEALREGGATLIRPGGRSERCSVRLLTDPAQAKQVRGHLKEKYTPEVYDRYFGRDPKVVCFRPGAPVVRRSDAELVREEFDAAAPGYTERVESNPIEQYLKQTTRDRLVQAYARDERLLEIGAGTGFETLPLLEAGHRVVAVDVSPRMLDELRRRAEARGVAERLTCRVGRLSDLPAALAEFEPSSFDGAYSTFGAFNLEEDLGSAIPSLARTLHPAAQLIFTSLNRPGGLAAAWEVAIGNPGGALARARGMVPAGQIRYPLPVYPRNTAFWDLALAPHFARRATLPVSVLAPPFESSRALAFLGARGGARLRRMDEWLSRQAILTPFAEWGFHVYRRVA